VVIDSSSPDGLFLLQAKSSGLEVPKVPRYLHTCSRVRTVHTFPHGSIYYVFCEEIDGGSAHPKKKKKKKKLQVYLFDPKIPLWEGTWSRSYDTTNTCREVSIGTYWVDTRALCYGVLRTVCAKIEKGPRIGCSSGEHPGSVQPIKAPASENL
jgi:hypothetical protein